MLKTSTGKLYTLLFACKPDNELVKKRFYISEIIEMPEYKALQVYRGADSVMNDYYSSEKLQNASIEQIEQVKKIIPILEKCIRNLYELIRFGDTRAIERFTYIDFYNFDVINDLYQVVSNVRKLDFNITNISEYEVWSFFDDNTITSLNNRSHIFNEYEMETLEAVIPVKLKDSLYCICAKEINERRNAYRSIYRKEETARVRVQIVENKIFVKKLILSLCSILLFVVPYAKNSMYFSGASKAFFVLLYLLIFIAYWILG